MCLNLPWQIENIRFISSEELSPKQSILKIRGFKNHENTKKQKWGCLDGAWTKLVAMLSVLCIILVGCGLFVKTPEPTPSPTSFKVDFNDESKYSKSNWVISPVIVPNSIEPNAIVDKDKKFIAMALLGLRGLMYNELRI